MASSPSTKSAATWAWPRCRGAMRRSKTNHRDTENTEKTRRKIERKKGFSSLLFLCVLSVFSVTLWFKSRSFAMPGFLAHYGDTEGPLGFPMTDKAARELDALLRT